MNFAPIELRMSHPLNDAKALCAALGLGQERGDRIPQGVKGLTVRCPSHGGVSCSVTHAPDGLVRVKCFGCDFSGDALTLVAQVRGYSMATEFRDVLREAAELANRYDILEELESAGEPRERRPAPPPPARKVEPEPDYPPIVEVRALLERCDPPSSDPEVSRWLESRGLDPNAVDGSECAFALRMDRGELPKWARFGGKSWCETGHRLIFPMHDASGEIRSVRAGRVVEGDSPKRVPPKDCKAAGLVLACSLAQAWLRGTWTPRLVVICEGEPDFLTWASKRSIDACARIGIVSGSWTPELAAKVPDGAVVAVRTDNDPAGDKYAAAIIEDLKTRCDVRRKRR